MPNPRFNKFYRYNELTRLLKAYAREYPNLIRLESIGKSHEGRDVWLVTATNFRSGPDTEKPAFWVDGNIHASEVTASACALYLIHSLVTRYKKDADITEALNTRAFYIVPRVNTDGAEWALADKPKVIRSGTRPYPFDEDPIEGLIANEDINGDGRLLSMRFPDPNGGWKQHPDDPRLMIRRDPVESGGIYYRLLPEGLIENYDGVTIQPAKGKYGLDFNRNFPVAWRPEADQHGAGPFPTSEAETRNLVEFVTAHPNITGSISLHTMSGVLLRPYDDRSDDEFPTEDLWTFKKIGDKGTAMTGYPNVSTFHDFKYHPKEITTGGFDTWAYDQRGLFSWTIEFWSPIRQAGIENFKFIDWYRDHPLEDDLKLMKWNDEVLKGKGFMPWKPFNHPQLGRVEIGGWDWLHMWSNPPLKFLEKEIAPFPDWIVWHALISPRLTLHSADVFPAGKDTYRVRLVVQNTGWLPTYVTKKALDKKFTRGVVAEIALPRGAALHAGKLREELGQLEGRAYHSAFTDDNEGMTNDRLKVEWVVHAPRGGTVKLSARHERAGVVHVALKLK
jgi:murein tripeptide amidase MpaA